MATFGKVNDLTTEFHFEWQIDGFFSLPEDGKGCYSPTFSFAREAWYLRIWRNGDSEENWPGYVGANLYRDSDGPPINLSWSLAVKTTHGNIDKGCHFTHVFKKAEGWGIPIFLKRSELSEKKSELVPSDVLTLVCHIDYYSIKSSDDAGNYDQFLLNNGNI